jgi:hypothetical protein
VRIRSPIALFRAVDWIGVVDTLGDGDGDCTGVWDCAIARARAGADATTGATRAARKTDVAIARVNQGLLTPDIYPRRPPSFNIWFWPL